MAASVLAAQTWSMSSRWFRIDAAGFGVFGERTDVVSLVDRLVPNGRRKVRYWYRRVALTVPFFRRSSDDDSGAGGVCCWRCCGGDDVATIERNKIEFVVETARRGIADV